MDGVRDRRKRSTPELVTLYPFYLMTLIAAMTFAATASFGQVNVDDYHNPERKYVDSLGISTQEDDYVRNDTFLSIGAPSSDGLSWTYHGHTPSLYGDYRGYISTDYTLMTYVEVGETSVAFVSANAPYVNGAGTSATLVGNTYTSENGTSYEFNGSGRMLSSILKPNGVRITLNSTGTCDTSTCNFQYTSAVTNTGFAFKFDNITGRVSAVNMLAHTCDAQALSCDAYDNYITKTQGFTDADFNGLGGKHQITDSLGNAWRYLVYFKYVIRNPLDPTKVQRGSSTVFAFKDPTGYLAQIAHNTTSGSVTSFTDPRGTFTYSGNVSLPNGSLLYSRGGTTTTTTQQLWFKDALNRQTTQNITKYYTSVNPINGAHLGEFTRVTSAVEPEGNSLSYLYDARGNVTQTTSTPKPGQGSAMIVYSASYPSTCTNLKTCNQPDWTRDAKLNQTDYTYSATHGGVLTVTLPVDTVGIRTRTYNTYTPFDTGNGIVYRLTRTETCGLVPAQLSLTACPTVVTTSVKVIDYGTSTTAPKTYKSSLPLSVTQTDGGATLSATTTYAYDNIGNVISVDGALAGTVDQSFTTYDANRRKIFEIGPIPNGTNNRAVVRHWYDADGREWKTENGYSSTNATDGSGFVVVNFTRVTYDAAGRPAKTEVVQP